MKSQRVCESFFGLRDYLFSTFSLLSLISVLFFLSLNREGVVAISLEHGLNSLVSSYVYDIENMRRMRFGLSNAVSFVLAWIDVWG